MKKFESISKSAHASFKNIDEITEAINLLSYDKYCEENFADIVTSSPLYTKDFYNL